MDRRAAVERGRPCRADRCQRVPAPAQVAGSASGASAVVGFERKSDEARRTHGRAADLPKDLSSTCAGGHRRVSARRFRAAGRVFRHPAAAARDSIDRALLKNSTLDGRLPARIPPGSHGPRLVMAVEAGGRPVSISRAITDRLQRSHAIEGDSPRRCSGDMYSSVPIRTRASVSRRPSTSSRDRQRLGNPEVQNFGHRALTSLRKIDVLGFEVAMDESSTVGSRDRRADVSQNRECPARCEVTVRFQDAAQGGAGRAAP